MARILRVSDASDRYFIKTYQAYRTGRRVIENKSTATCPTHRIGTCPSGRTWTLFLIHYFNRPLADKKGIKMAIDCRDGIRTHTNPTKVIRQKCLDCCCGSRTEVDQCTVKDCPLFDWRLGTNPYRRKRQLSDEQRQAAKVRLQYARKNTHAENSLL